MKTKVKQLRPAQIVRNVMRKYGKNTLYTNKYKTMRTVKCYAGPGGAGYARDELMVTAINRALKKVGVKSLGVNFTTHYHKGYHWAMDSVIIQLPL